MAAVAAVSCYHHTLLTPEQRETGTINESSTVHTIRTHTHAPVRRPVGIQQPKDGSILEVVAWRLFTDLQTTGLAMENLH